MFHPLTFAHVSFSPGKTLSNGNSCTSYMVIPRGTVWHASINYTMQGWCYLVYNFPFCSMTRHNAICLFNSFSMTRIRPGLCIRARPCEKVLMNNCVCLWFWRNWHEILPRNDRENDLLVIIHTPRLTDCKEWRIQSLYVSKNALLLIDLHQ